MSATNHTQSRNGLRRDPGRGATAVVVTAVGVLASLSAHPGAALLELMAFVLVAGYVLLFSSRRVALVLALGMAILTVWNNYDISASSSPTGRALGAAALIVLLYIVAFLGIVVDLVARLVWHSLHWKPPTE